MSSQPRFYILKHRIKGTEISNMLGRIVKRFTSPGDDYTPERPSDIVDLSIDSTVQTDAAIFIQSLKDNNLRALLGDCLSFGQTSGQSEDLRLKSTRITTLRLRQREDTFGALIANNIVKKKASELLPVGGKLYMVVGVMICERSTVGAAGSRGGKRQGSGAVPLTAGVVPIINGDIKIEAVRSTSSDWTLEATAEEPQIFAVEYQVVRRSFVGFGKSIVLQDRSFSGGLMFGGNESEGEESEGEDSNEVIVLGEDYLTPASMGMERGKTAQFDEASGFLWFG